MVVEQCQRACPGGGVARQPEASYSDRSRHQERSLRIARNAQLAFDREDMKLQDDAHATTYEAAARWVVSALRNDDSLFTPGIAIWTADNLDDLHARFVAKPDDSSDAFLGKFRRQLSEAPDATIQLAAEALYIHFLIAWMSGAAKRAVIEPVLGWMREPVTIPPDLSVALDHG